MRKHSLIKIDNLKKKRKAGYSIHELMKEFSMPKTTIWHHVHDIKLSENQLNKIREKQGGSKIRAEKQWLEAKNLAKQIIKSINIYQVSPVILSLLYWAEGNKKGFVFTNTDAQMVKIFLKVLRERFGIRNHDIIATIRINTSNNKAACIDYWHQITKIPKSSISVDFNSKNNKSKSKYGILRIVVRKGGRLFKLVNSLNSELTSNVISSILDKNIPLVAQLD